MNPLVIATHNEGKVKEFGELLAGRGIHVVSAGSLRLPEPEETGQTFAENACLKSESAAKLSGHYALADDSGLCIEALGGAPGIYSASWAGPGKDFNVAFERIGSDLEGKGQELEGAKAHFICVLALTAPDGKTETFEGRVDGRLTDTPRGEGGFGYDPIFIPDGHEKTFAEMDTGAKHAVSHRARALAKFMDYVATHLRKAAS
jgi:XTP/dITP diphosphohydrolase